MAAKATNVGGAERIGSTIAGAALVLRALARPSLGRIIAALGGAALLRRGLTGHCPLYGALGVDTAAHADGGACVERDRVLEASEDSFPASDPPAWIPVTGAANER